MIDIKALREENEAALKKLREDIAQRQADYDASAASADAMLRRSRSSEQGDLVYKTHLNEPEPLSASERSELFAYIDQRVAQVVDETIDIIADELGELMKEVDGEIKGALGRLTDLEVEAKARHRSHSDHMHEDMALIRRSLETMQEKIDEACSRSEGVVPFVKRVN